MSDNVYNITYVGYKNNHTSCYITSHSFNVSGGNGSESSSCRDGKYHYSLEIQHTCLIEASDGITG